MTRWFSIFKIPDLRRKLFIVGGILVVSRLLASIPIPNIDITQLRAFLESSQLLGFLNLLSGSTLENFSIAMLGVGPYITATIIMQLLTMIFPRLKELYYEEGEAGRRRFNRLSRFITVPLSAIQAYGLLNLLTAQGVIPRLSLSVLLWDVVIITAGSMLLLWLGDLITEQKIGNGISFLIFAGIVSGVPSFIQQTIASYSPQNLPVYIAFIILAVLVIAGVIFITEGERKVPVSYAKRVRGMKLYGGASSYLPLRVNQAGVIPIIFAISLLLFPQFAAQILAIFSPDLSLRMTNFVNGVLGNQLIYGFIYFFLVFVFTYFYTAVVFDPQEISKNLQRSGGFILGIRPGEPTGQFLQKIISRTTLFGAIFLGIIAILPIFTQYLTGVSTLTLGGTALLIVVSVALEIRNQIESQLAIRNY
ncbi:MAG: preprotein translocase subunit SecY [Candidatus Harrisonbacteria bacterium RIFCSPLOWO2_01_FULL_40_28]|uniref:Protein translocase subunit SecY n=1 Tax=Candidatus Harrisonbacteria bacterium RIFCSPLOWO2_01_FULL_40_28 TaxID=1798406 RepID=A0A1G1ZL72_9BACT|nr:MAG: preprotein translocase subunit SecY [Candidatus Harrisonbacteria bacterium RIFCSPLOWO2_01_FULL_40_28]